MQKSLNKQFQIIRNSELNYEESIIYNNNGRSLNVSQWCSEQTIADIAIKFVVGM